MKKLITCIIFLSFYLYSQSQQDVKILTPEASGLAKYVEIPVGYFGGVPQINIPLYEIVDGDIIIPITLSYHAGGHKVNEESSIVGLGWSLNVGGEIILAKRGGGGKGPDTIVEDFDDNIPMPTSTDDMNPHYHMLEGYSDGRYLAENGEYKNYFCDDWLGYNFKELDGERDLYIFNFHNYTGKFMFVRKWVDNSIKIVPEVIDRQNIKFKKIGASPNISDRAYGGKYIYEATTEDGFIYRFGVMDFSRSVIKKVYKSGGILNGGVYPDVVSSYKLTSVQSPTSNRLITFSYLTPTGRSVHSPSYDYHLKKRKYSNFPTSLTDWHDSYEQFSYAESQNRYLEHIVFSGGTVSFYYSDRLDIYNGKKLDSIIVRNKNNDIIKRISFNTLLPQDQSYFTSLNSYPDPYPSSIDNSTLFSEIKNRAGKRLKLTDISIGADLYQFKYYEDVMLPPKTSQAMDYWGFYNGASNSTLLPKPMDLQYYASYVPQELGNVIGADRKPNANFMHANILKTIIYPTKGESSFVYEPHSFKSIGQTVEYKSIQALDNNDFSSSILPGKDFEIENTQTVTGGFWLQRKMPLNSYSVPLGNVWVAIQEFKNNTYQNLYTYQNGRYTECLWDLHKEYNTYKETSKMPTGCEISEDGFQFHGDFSLTLTTGKYRIVAYYSNDYGFDVKCKSNISLNYYLADGDRKDLIGGGLRVKEIRVDVEKGKPITRKFSYEDGVNLSIPKFIREEKLPSVSMLQFCPESGMTPTYWADRYRLNGQDPYSFPGFLHGYDLFSSNVYDFSNSANGSFVGYKKVTVQYSGEENGKSDYFFNISNPSLNGISAPRGIPDVNNIDIGLLTSEKHYKSMASNIFMLIKEITYSYNAVYDRFVTWNWIAEEKPYYAKDPREPEMETVPSWILTTDDVIHLYPVVFGKKLLVSKKETFLGSPDIISETAYLYNKDGYLKAESFENSSGEKIENEYIYPNDYTSIDVSNEWIKLMKNANILKYPIETVQRKNDKVVGATFNEYKSPYGLSLSDSYKTDLNESLSNFNFSNDFAGNKDSHYSLNASYKYDKKGNITNLILKESDKVVYLWSYCSQYPIAEIKNATLNEVNTILNSVFGVTDIDALSALLKPNETKLKDGSLQRALPNALVTTYTYKPLVGILTATDPAGITTYYEYDLFGRLKEIYIYKDDIVSLANKQIIQSYDYHYQNQ